MGNQQSTVDVLHLAGTASKDQAEPDRTNKDVMASDQAGHPSKSGNRRLPEAAWQGQRS